MKICTHCQVEQPLENFPADKKSSTGHRSQCKKCKSVKAAKYNAANKEEISAHNKEWRANNQGVVIARRKKYLEENSEQIRAKKAAAYAADPKKVVAHVAAWRKANPEKKTIQDKKYRKKHKEELAKKSRAWALANPEKIRQVGVNSEARKRAHKKNDPHNDLTTAQWQEILIAYNFRCIYCPLNCWLCLRKKHALTQDHITPLSKGGSNTASNVVPCCKKCNSEKGIGPAPIPIQPLLLTIAPPRKPKPS